MNEIGRRIKVKRAERGCTQAELARRLGVCFQTISKWENGTAQPGIDLLPALADALETSIDELLGHSARCKKQVAGPDKELLLERAMELTAPGGALYYQTIDGAMELQDAALFAAPRHMKLTAFEHDTNWGFDCRYYKFTKE